MSKSFRCPDALSTGTDQSLCRLLEGATIQQAPEAEPEADVDFDALVAQSSAQPDPETLREEKRKRRAALLAQYSATTPADSPLSVASPLLTGSISATPGLNSPAKRLRLDSPATRDGTESPDQEAKFDLVDLEKHEQPTVNPTNTDENISAADYNPDEDRREDDARQLRHRGEVGAAGQAGATAVAAQEVLEGGGEEEDEEEEDDEDDMFAIDAKPKKVKSGKKKASGMVVCRLCTVTGRANLILGHRSRYNSSSAYRRSRRCRRLLSRDTG